MSSKPPRPDWHRLIRALGEARESVDFGDDPSLPTEVRIQLHRFALRVLDLTKSAETMMRKVQRISPQLLQSEIQKDEKS